MRLTYCGNVHPAEDLDSWLDVTRRHAAPVAAAARAAGRRFGLGSWWSAPVAAALAGSAECRERVADLLVELPLWTLNAFPYAGFHDAAVKTAVYSPDWSDPQRLRYTLDVAAAAAVLAPEGAEVPISTLPLGYRAPGDAAFDEEHAAHQLRVASRALRDLRAAHGRHLTLALEPEPDCLLETVAATADFLERRVFAGQSDEAVLRAHLGVCVDLCHLEVVGEDAVAAFAALRRRGIGVPKVQVSSCLELRDPAAHLDDLLAFAEPRYLHQTSADRGRLRALDLPEVAARRAEFAASDCLHTHFHLPLFWDDPQAPLGSTRPAVERFLAALDPAAADLPLLEVETYTWGVFDPAWNPERDLTAGLIRELDFAAALVRG